MIALLFFPPRTQACPPPSLWMVSSLRRFSSSHPLQHRLQTLIASNPPLPIHRQPRSRCANLLRSSLATNIRCSGVGGVRTQVLQRWISQTSARSTVPHPTVCSVPAVDLRTRSPWWAAKHSSARSMSQRLGFGLRLGVGFKRLRRGQSNFK